MDDTTALLDLPRLPFWRRLWHADAVMTVVERDAHGMALCELRYRRWHPHY
ncbi:MAG: hypothetical protein IT357_12775, partial [Gemmatimonadaceae bacterium]|nr:hypothetical protein [Gemmatimonadaceae bacterium]